MRHYETIYIVNPNLTAEEHQDVLKRYSSLIEKNKGVTIKTEEWGVQRLAYEVKKFDKGSYVLLNYCGDPGLTAELERDLNLNDKILKYQTVKIADKVNPQDLLQEERDERKETVVTQEQSPPEPPEVTAGAPETEPRVEEESNA